MNVEIHIFNQSSKVAVETPKEFDDYKIKEATSYFVEGAQFSKPYKRGVWDGYKRLMTRDYLFPTGLLQQVVVALQEDNHSVQVVDNRDAPEPQGGTFDLNTITLRDYQLDAAQKAVEAKQGILKIATGGGKTALAVALTKYFGLKTLFVVNTKELIYQAKASYEKEINFKSGELGYIGDGKWEPGSFVTIASIDTLYSRYKNPECAEFLREIDVMFIDECHTASSDSFYSIAISCPAFYRFGLSATPLDRTDGGDLRLLGCVGDLIVDIPNKLLVDKGILPRANIIFDKITAPEIPKKTQYASVYKLGVSENEQLLGKVVEWTKIAHERNLSVLILAEEIKHGKAIDKALWDSTDGAFIPHQFIFGEDKTAERKQALDSFQNRRLPVLIASTILDVGVSIDTIDVLILAGSKKSKIRTLQRLGRALRSKMAIVIEFSNFCHRYLLEHSLKRFEDYKAEECFPVHSSAPDGTLIDKIMDTEGWVAGVT